MNYGHSSRGIYRVKLRTVQSTFYPHEERVTTYNYSESRILTHKNEKETTLKKKISFKLFQ